MTLDTILTASSEIYRRRPKQFSRKADSRRNTHRIEQSERGDTADVSARIPLRCESSKVPQRGDAAKLIPSRIRSRNTIRLANVNDSTAAIVQHLHRPTDADGCYLRSQAWGLSQADRRARRPADADGRYLCS
jgi:hypothetical protein